MQQRDLPSSTQSHSLPPQQLLKQYGNPQFNIKNKYNPDDPRLKQLNHLYFFNKQILDIGCGQGNLTLQIAIRYFPLSIEGIDLSDYLIRYANNVIERLKKQQQKKELKKKELPIKNLKITNNITMIHLKQGQQLLTILHQLPDSIIQCSSDKPNYKQQICYSLKSIDLELNTPPEPKIKFPQNISYKIQNYFNYDRQKCFDTIICMSVAKCIHLTFGDEGIKVFFNKIYEQLKVPGIFIFEVQQYKSYKKDKNNSEINQKNFRQMQLKPKDYINYLKQLGLELIQTINHKQIQSIKKNILIFSKN